MSNSLRPLFNTTDSNDGVDDNFATEPGFHGDKRWNYGGGVSAALLLLIISNGCAPSNDRESYYSGSGIVDLGKITDNTVPDGPPAVPVTDAGTVVTPPPSVTPPTTLPDTPREYPTPLCDGETWLNPSFQELALSLGIDQLIAISSDGLSALGEAHTIDDVSSIPILHRMSVSDPFELIAEWEFPEELDPNLGIALSPDGLTLIAVETDSASLMISSRDSANDNFNSEMQREFAQIANDYALQLGQRFAFPVWGKNSIIYRVETNYEKQFMLSVIDPLFGMTPPTPLNLDYFLYTPTDNFIPTSLSSDDLTLLVRDQNQSSTEAWWRQAEDLPFLTSQSLSGSNAFYLVAPCRLVDNENGALKIEAP